MHLAGKCIIAPLLVSAHTKQMAIQFAYMNSLLIYVLIFQRVIANFDYRPQDDKVVVQDPNDVNCAELEETLKKRSIQQHLVLVELDDWTDEHCDENNEESDFEQIDDAKKRILGIQHELGMCQTVFDNTIRFAKIDHADGKLEDADTANAHSYIATIDAIQTQFKKIFLRVMLINKMMDDFISLSNSFDRVLAPSVRLQHIEIGRLFEDQNCAAKIKKQQNTGIYSNPWKTYQHHSFLNTATNKFYIHYQQLNLQ